MMLGVNMNLKIAVSSVSLLLSQTVWAQEIAVFYLAQIQGDLKSFILLSDGRGMSSDLVSREEHEVSVGRHVFTALWSRFPSQTIAPYELSESEKTEIHALNHHLLKVQRVEEGERSERNYMVPHTEAPQNVTAWIAEYLEVFGETMKVGASSE